MRRYSSDEDDHSHLGMARQPNQVDPISYDRVAADFELARQLAAGDVRALEFLYDRYGALAYSLAIRVLGDSGLAEDVVQDVYLKVWTTAGRFDSTRGSLRGWLLTAVRNRSIDYLRGRAAHARSEKELPESLAATGSGSEPWHDVSLAIDQKLIREALDNLPPEQRQAIELAFFQGCSGKEIALLVQVPLSTVKGRMRLGLEKLHSILQARGFVYE